MGLLSLIVTHSFFLIILNPRASWEENEARQEERGKWKVRLCVLGKEMRMRFEIVVYEKDMEWCRMWEGSWWKGW